MRTKLDEKAWQRFEKGQLRDFTVKVASPHNTPNIEHEGNSVSEAFRSFSKAYDTPIITIGFGMGHRKGGINSLKEFARSIERLGESGDTDLRSLKAKVKADEVEPAEDINLMDQIFSDSVELDYRKNDPDENYRKRKETLEGLFKAYG